MSWAFSLAGFEVTLNGRIWVTPEESEVDEGKQHRDIDINARIQQKNKEARPSRNEVFVPEKATSLFPRT